MKCNYMLLVLILLLSARTGVAQQEDENLSLNFKHIQGLHGIDVSYGLSKKNYSIKHGSYIFGNFYEAGYSVYLRKDLIIRTSVNYEYGIIGLTDFKDYNLMFSGQYTFLHLRDFIYFNARLGLLAGFENVNNEDLDIKESYFVYGVFAGPEVEIFIIDKLALILDMNQQYNFKSKLGTLHYQVGGGIRVLIN